MVKENINRHFVAVLKALIVLCFLALVFVFTQGVSKRLDVYLRIRAVEECSKISTFEQKETKEEVVAYEGRSKKTESVAKYPIKEAYKRCLQDKGY